MNDFRKELLRYSQRKVAPVISTLALLLALLALGLAFHLLRENEKSPSVQQEASKTELNDQVDLFMNETRLLAEQMEMNSERIGLLMTDLAAVQKKVGITQSELEKTRTATEQIRQEQQKNVQLLTRQLVTKAEATRLENLAERTGTLLEEFDEITRLQESQQDLETQWGNLSQMGLRLTDEGKLIATNAEALEELKRRGSRKEYLKFDVRKSEEVRVANVIIELKKTDQKRKRADLRLRYDSKQSDMNKVYMNTVLIFYVDSIQYELVIYEVNEDQIAGYISY